MAYNSYGAQNFALALEPVWEPAPSLEVDEFPIEMHPAYQRILAAMPPLVKSSFTRQQLRWISIASMPPPVRHMVQYRASLKLLFKRYYLTVFFGEESRSLERLRGEGQLSILRRLAGYYLMMSMLAAAIIIGGVFILYVIKSICGIDLTEGPSILHGLFF